MTIKSVLFPRSLRLSLATFALLLTHVVASGQADSGRIAGTLTDQNGGLVPNASVVVKNEKTGEERTVTSSDDGAYTVTSLRPSLYTLTATTQGLSVTATNIQVLVGQEAKLNLTLQPSGVTAAITVEAGADGAINTDSASLGANVNPREVGSLPLIN